MTPSLAQLRMADTDLLSEWDLSENVRAMGDCIPGYRSSASEYTYASTPTPICPSSMHISVLPPYNPAESHKLTVSQPPTAFLTTLRSNLHLSTTDQSPYSSLVSTPTASAFTYTSQLAYPNPSPLSINSTPPPPPAPPLLTTHILPPQDASPPLARALQLIATSIREQRWQSSKAALSHQITIATLLLSTSILYKLTSPPLLSLLLLLSTLISLSSLYLLTLPYASLARSINTTWLHPPTPTSRKPTSRTDDPIVLVSRYDNDTVIAALVLRLVKKERKAYIRAWTVDRGFRGRGVGSGLLEEAVRVAWGKGARCVVFDEKHANSHRVLPEVFAGSVEERERRARMLLASTVAEVRREKSSR